MHGHQASKNTVGYIQRGHVRQDISWNHSMGFPESNSSLSSLTSALMTCEPVFKEAEALLDVFKNTLVFGWNSHMAQYTLLKDEVASLQVVTGHFHHKSIDVSAGNGSFFAREQPKKYIERELNLVHDNNIIPVKYLN